MTRPSVSTTVEMTMSTNGMHLRVAQLAPDYAILCEPPPASPPAPAIISVRVDDKERLLKAHLPNGLVAGERKTPISPDPNTQQSVP